MRKFPTLFTLGSQFLWGSDAVTNIRTDTYRELIRLPVIIQVEERSASAIPRLLVDQRRAQEGKRGNGGVFKAGV